MDADYSDLPDDELKEVRQEVQRRLRVIEQEMARRREEKHGARYWYCDNCASYFRNPDGDCFSCGKPGQPLRQGELVEQAEMIHE